MSNTITEVTDSIFSQSMDALRNATTLPRLVRTDWKNEVAKKGQTISIPLPPTLTVGDVSPSATPLATEDVERTTVDITLNYWRRVSLHLTDKEAGEMADGSRNGDLTSVAEALASDVNAKILALYKEVYGYAGVAGTTPFATDLSELIDAQKVLFDQKCPLGNRFAILSGAAQVNALNLRAIQDFKGSDSIINGQIGRVLGFDVYADQQVPTHTLVGDDCALDDSAARAVGTKTLHMDGLTTAPAAGDVFTIAGDDQTYTVVSSTTLVGTDSDVTFEPGLVVAIPAVDGNEVVTFKADHVVNLVAHRDAFALATRPLAAAGDFAGGNMIRTDVDPLTGLGFTLEVSRQHMQTAYVWTILYGVKCIRPEYACRIAG